MVCYVFCEYSLFSSSMEYIGMVNHPTKRKMSKNKKMRNDAMRREKMKRKLHTNCKFEMCTLLAQNFKAIQ